MKSVLRLFGIFASAAMAISVYQGCASPKAPKGKVGPHFVKAPAHGKKPDAARPAKVGSRAVYGVITIVKREPTSPPPAPTPVSMARKRGTSVRSANTSAAFDSGQITVTGACSLRYSKESGSTLTSVPVVAYAAMVGFRDGAPTIETGPIMSDYYLESGNGYFYGADVITIPVTSNPDSGTAINVQVKQAFIDELYPYYQGILFVAGTEESGSDDFAEAAFYYLQVNPLP